MGAFELKERFPELRKSKLMPRAAGPFKVLEKINDNAYKLELPPDFRVSPTFNISDLKPYFGEEDELESRMTPIQEGGDDEDITPLHTMQGPITRARARQLNLQVCSFLVNYFSNLTVGGAHVLLIRNLGEYQQGLGKGRGVEEEQLGRPHRAGAQAQLDFDSISESRSRPHQN